MLICSHHPTSPSRPQHLLGVNKGTAESSQGSLDLGAERLECQEKVHSCCQRTEESREWLSSNITIYKIRVREIKPKNHKPAALESCLWVTFCKPPAEGRLVAKTNNHGSD